VGYWISLETYWQKLQSNLTLKRSVLCEVDFTHTTLANLLCDPVMRDCLPFQAALLMLEALLTMLNLLGRRGNGKRLGFTLTDRVGKRENQLQLIMDEGREATLPGKLLGLPL
jgi:hypothetical protein